jgi:hypothetical protein
MAFVYWVFLFLSVFFISRELFNFYIKRRERKKWLSSVCFFVPFETEPNEDGSFLKVVFWGGDKKKDYLGSLYVNFVEKPGFKGKVIEFLSPERKVYSSLLYPSSKDGDTFCIENKMGTVKAFNKMSLAMPMILPLSGEIYIEAEKAKGVV